MTAVLRFEPHVVGSDLADLRGSVRLPGGEEDRHQPVQLHGNRSITAMRRLGRQEARTLPSCSTEQTNCRNSSTNDAAPWMSATGSKDTEVGSGGNAAAAWRAGAPS